MSFVLSFTIYDLIMFLLASYGTGRLLIDIVGALGDRPALPAAEEQDEEADADLDLALAQHGVTVEADERSVTAVTVDGVRISGPELSFELPDNDKLACTR